MTADKHALVVVDPGHFHAALTLRQPHPRLADDVYVYAEGGPDLERFLDIVAAFNRRPVAPTRWRLHVYRGGDYLQRLRAERPGRLAIVAGRNDRKMALIERLHAHGFSVLADKPWVIGSDQLGALRAVTTNPPLAMDIMTERHEVAVRVQHALMRHEAVFGSLHAQPEQPALFLQSVHYLYKLVNQRPLVRPAWYFDVRVQGEGITDVNTHLVDLAQWLIGNDRACDTARDVELIAARQWPTAVPRERFRQITGLEDFPAALHGEVSDGALQYLCNASLSCRMCGVPVQTEVLWALAIPEGGADTHRICARGTRAQITVELDATTGFRTELTVRPQQPDAGYAQVLAAALASLQHEFPGLASQPAAGGYRIVIPDALRTTHEEHFALVLDEFIGYAECGKWPDRLGPDLVAKYTLLQRAREMAHGPAGGNEGSTPNG
jgi:predicted dehydrogenase